MGKKLRMLWGGVVGAALQYMFDPTSGRSRRARLKDQAAAQLRDVTRMIDRRVRYQRGRFRGVAHEMSTGWNVDDHKTDDGLADLHEVRTSGNSRYT